MQHRDKHTFNIRRERIDETLKTETYNICVQTSQHMQHHELLLQHPSEALATYL
jgi:hypothetical protein